MYILLEAALGGSLYEARAAPFLGRKYGPKVF